MRTFVIKRLMAAIPLILIVTFITKALLVISPGDYLSILRDNPALSQEYYDRMQNREVTNDVAGVAELIIAKQRNGPTDKLKMAWLEQYARFDNIAEGEAPF